MIGYKHFLEEFDCECATNHWFYYDYGQNEGHIIHHCEKSSSWYHNMLYTYLHKVHNQHPTLSKLFVSEALLTQAEYDYQYQEMLARLCK